MVELMQACWAMAKLDLDLEPDEVLVIFDALYAWDEIIDENIEMGQQPASDRKYYDSAMSKLGPMARRIRKKRGV